MEMTSKITKQSSGDGLTLSQFEANKKPHPSWTKELQQASCWVSVQSPPPYELRVSDSISIVKSSRNSHIHVVIQCIVFSPSE